MLQNTLRSPALCLIVDYSYVTNSLFEQRINEVIDGGIDIVQFRDKNISHEKLLLTGEKLKRNINGRILFAVNSDIRAAINLEADILHLPEISDDVTTIRETYKDRFIIGKSVHTTKSAIMAESDGVDYVTLGTIFDSNSKPGGVPAGTNLIETTAKEIDIPIFAIGGVNANNVGSVILAGAYGAAVISAISGQSDQKSASIAMKIAMNEIAN